MALLTAGAALHYLGTTPSTTGPSTSERFPRLREWGTLWMDGFTIRNLELVQPNHSDGTSLAQTIDRTGDRPWGRGCSGGG